MHALRVRMRTVGWTALFTGNGLTEGKGYRGVMRGPRGVTTAMRGWYIGWRQDEAGRGGERGSGWRGTESQSRSCGKLKRGQIEINSRVTKPRLKY